MIPSTIFHTMADANSVGSAMRAFVTPVLITMGGFATLVSTFFLVNGGLQYMSSSGKPEHLEHAKRTIRNAVIGLILVLGAGILTTILTHSYSHASSGIGTKLPNLTTITPAHTSFNLVDVIIKTITGVLNNIVQSAAAPFMQALKFFTSSTPLMGDNSVVFNLWAAMVGIADALFALVLALIGFHRMSASSFGLRDIDLKELLPQIVIVFALLNTSIFIIDGVISLSNAMIRAIQAGFPSSSVWDVLSKVAAQSGGLGLAALLIMIVFLTLSIILLVYYVGRLVTLYIGAALSPLILLLWLVPGYKDFAISAAKSYLTTVFVLFVHVVILLLAASIFSSLIAANPNHTPDPIMALVVGLATVTALLKTQGVMMQLSYASIGPRAARRLGGQFINGISYVAGEAIGSAKEQWATDRNRNGYSMRRPFIKEALPMLSQSVKNGTVAVGQRFGSGRLVTESADAKPGKQMLSAPKTIKNASVAKNVLNKETPYEN